MANIGCLGDIPFMVSDSALQTINKVVWSGSVRYSEHQRHLTNALTEFTGIDADKFSFDMYLSNALGIKPMDAINKIWKHERAATSLTLVIGEKAYGKYRWTITDHKISMENFDAKGNMVSATVSVSLLEYLKE